MPPHPSGQGLVGGGCGQHFCSERGWGSRAGVFVGFLALGVGWLSPAPTWEQPPAPLLFLTVFFFFFFLLPAGTVGVQLPGLQEYGAMGGSPHAVSAAMWACQHCTFMNQPGTEHCEMCSLPRT